MKQYLFSYGTLSPDHAPPEIAPIVRQLRPIGSGKVRGRLYDLGEYPGAVLSKMGSDIVGQVFEIPDTPGILEKLDEYEGFEPSQPDGSLFVRKRSLVSLDNGKRAWCWIYTYNRHPGSSPSVVGGDSSKMRGRRSR